jgi:hypothetical protein
VTHIRAENILRALLDEFKRLEQPQYATVSKSDDLPGHKHSMHGIIVNVLQTAKAALFKFFWIL